MLLFGHSALRAGDCSIRFMQRLSAINVKNASFPQKNIKSENSIKQLQQSPWCLALAKR